MRVLESQIKFPAVMGVINMSPDSFFNPISGFDDALCQADKMLQAGASIIDVGGEATNPTINIAAHVPSVQQQIDRVMPAIEAIHARLPVLISIDTSEPAVMQAAVQAGAAMINDQRALTVEGALQMAVSLQVPVCLMHMFNPPRQPASTTVQEMLLQIKNELHARIDVCVAAGLARELLVIDPGFGGGNYGKNRAENFYLLRHLAVFLEFELPLLVGLSRKSFLGEALGGASPEQRLHASVAAATLALQQGANIIRAHDVKATVDAMKVVIEMMVIKTRHPCVAQGS